MLWAMALKVPKTAMKIINDGLEYGAAVMLKSFILFKAAPGAFEAQCHSK